MFVLPNAIRSVIGRVGSVLWLVDPYDQDAGFFGGSEDFFPKPPQPFKPEPFDPSTPMKTKQYEYEMIFPKLRKRPTRWKKSLRGPRKANFKHVWTELGKSFNLITRTPLGNLTFRVKF